MAPARANSPEEKGRTLQKLVLFNPGVFLALFSVVGLVALYVVVKLVGPAS